MAIDLLNRFTSGQVNKTSVTQNNGVTVNIESAEAAKIIRSVYAMKAGDILRGELLSVKGMDISLLLGNAVTLSAKMDKELMMSPGKMMSFTVNSNQNGKLSLSPLFANTGMEQNAIKALDAANIPVMDKSLAMAEELMKQGMPVNKQTLSTIFRQIGMYPEAGVSDIVMLHKMNLPVSQENISNMHLYQSNQQYLFSDMQGLSSQISTFLTDMTANQPMESVQGFVHEFLQIFTGAQNEHTMVFTQEGQNVNIQTTPSDSMPQNIVPLTVSEQVEVATAEIPEMIKMEDVVKTADGKVILSQDFGTDSLQNLKNNAIPLKEAEVMELLRNENLHTDALRMQLTKSIFNLLKENFLMKPEDVASSKKVKEFYEHLDSQMDKLQNLLKNTGNDNSGFAKEVNTIKSNMQFMNQINEMYHYVQLPIKMNENAANGDLYVYKRKHSKTGEDGKLTALLHLSMPTLGKMDVFLTLEEQKLSTRFCLEKEEMIDFIEANIDQLNSRLIEKGYHVQTSVTADRREEEQSVIDTILATEPSIPIITSKSFDARC